MPKQAAKLLFLSPFPLGEGPGMGPYVLIGGFCVYPLNSYIKSIDYFEFHFEFTIIRRVIIQHILVLRPILKTRYVTQSNVNVGVEYIPPVVQSHGFRTLSGHSQSIIGNSGAAFLMLIADYGRSFIGTTGAMNRTP